MSLLAHVQANENKLENIGPTFSSSNRDFPFYSQTAYNGVVYQ